MARNAARLAAQQTLGRLPRSAARLGPPLALDGGKPVRDTRLRPWKSANSSTLMQWMTTVGPALKRVFLSGLEGLPQSRQKEFAQKWARYCGCEYGLMLPHGTDALRFALAAAFDHDGLAYGGEVIVPNLSFIASATSALDRRFGVALVDVDADTLNIDPKCVERAIVPGKTRAIVPVHQFGQPADMDSLRDIAARHGLKIIEDAAQAHGARWKGDSVGCLGDAAAFSFQTSKNLACGEGGILTTNDRAIFDRAFSLHNAGRSPEHGSRWEHESLGWNCRPTEYQAALLLHRFSSYEAEQATRLENFSKLRGLLAADDCVKALLDHPGVTRHGMYMFVLRYAPERCGNVDVESFLRALGAEGAPVYRCYAATMSSQPVMKGLLARRPEYVRLTETPVSDKAVDEILYIPGHVFLGTTEDMEDIVAAIRKVQSHYRSRPGAPKGA